MNPDRRVVIEMPESRWRAVLVELERMDWEMPKIDAHGQPISSPEVGEHSEQCFEAMRHLRVALGPART